MSTTPPAAPSSTPRSSIDPRLRVAWERFLSMLPWFAVLSVVAVWAVSGVLLAGAGAIPVHFDAAGNPNGFGPWWMLAAISTGVLVVMGLVHLLVRWLVVNHPTWVNVPAKAQFLALSPEARRRIVPRLGQLLMGFVLLVNLGMLALTRDTHRIVMRELQTIAVWKLIVLLVLALVWVVVCVVRVRNAIRREAAAAGLQ